MFSFIIGRNWHSPCRGNEPSNPCSELKALPYVREPVCCPKLPTLRPQLLCRRLLVHNVEPLHRISTLHLDEAREVFQKQQSADFRAEPAPMTSEELADIDGMVMSLEEQMSMEVPCLQH